MLNIKLNSLTDFRIGTTEYVTPPIYNRLLALLYQNDLTLLSNLGQSNFYTDEAKTATTTGFLMDVVKFGTWDDNQDIIADVSGGVLSLSIDINKFMSGIDRWNLENPSNPIDPISWVPLEQGIDYANSSIIGKLVADAKFENGEYVPAQFNFQLKTQTNEISNYEVKLSATDTVPGYLLDKIYPAHNINISGLPTTAAGQALWSEGEVWLYPQIVYDNDKAQLYFGLGRHLVPDIDYKCRLMSVVNTKGNGLFGGFAYEDLYKTYTNTARSWLYPLAYLKELIVPTTASPLATSVITMKQSSQVVSSDDSCVYLPEKGRLVADTVAHPPGDKEHWDFAFNIVNVEIKEMKKKLADIFQAKEVASGPQLHTEAIYFNGDRRYMLYFNRSDFSSSLPVPTDQSLNYMAMLMTGVSGMTPLGYAVPNVKAVGIRSTAIADRMNPFIQKPADSSNIDLRNAHSSQGLGCTVSQRIVAMNKTAVKMRMESDGLPLTDINNCIDAVELKENSEIVVFHRPDKSIYRIEVGGRVFAGQLQREGIMSFDKILKSVNCRFLDGAGKDMDDCEFVLATMTTHYIGE